MFVIIMYRQKIYMKLDERQKANTITGPLKLFVPIDCSEGRLQFSSTYNGLIVINYFSNLMTNGCTLQVKLERCENDNI